MICRNWKYFNLSLDQLKKQISLEKHKSYQKRSKYINFMIEFSWKTEEITGGFRNVYGNNSTKNKQQFTNHFKETELKMTNGSEYNCILVTDVV